MKRQIQKILFIVDLWGTPGWYKGIDKITLWDYIYKRRVSLKTAIKTAKIIYS